jgi:hypothetical protein
MAEQATVNSGGSTNSTAAERMAPRLCSLSRAF